jgi:hypothetical protein
LTTTVSGYRSRREAWTTAGRADRPEWKRP